MRWSSTRRHTAATRSVDSGRVLWSVIRRPVSAPAISGGSTRAQRGGRGPVSLRFMNNDIDYNIEFAEHIGIRYAQYAPAAAAKKCVTNPVVTTLVYASVRPSINLDHQTDGEAREVR